ncbi:MAG: hypothetical protein H6R33_858 [Actinobacteria bacterium]|nr:hypothetical protein [Actinomycetota bacterium]
MVGVVETGVDELEEELGSTPPPLQPAASTTRDRTTRPRAGAEHDAGTGGTLYGLAAMATPADVPRRVAPAAMSASASCRVRIPPAALTPMSGPTARRISATS